MSAAPAIACSSYPVDRARVKEATPLRKTIAAKIGLKLDDPHTTSIEDQLLSAYPKLEVEDKLGKGHYSTAYLCTYGHPDGTERKIVLKLGSRVKSKGHEQFSRLDERRAGGEFWALHDFGEHVVKTEAALVYDAIDNKMRLVSAENVQKLFHDPKARGGMKWIFIGSVSEFVKNSFDFCKALIAYKKPLSALAVHEYAKQMLAAIGAIHGAGLVHRDIKPDNMLLVVPYGWMPPEDALEKGAGEILFLDFGFAKMIEKNRKRHTRCGTPQYMAPETVLDEKCTSAVDLYSFASTLSNMATARLPFRKNQDFFGAVAWGKDILGEHVDRFPDVDPRLKDLIKGLGRPDPNKRMTLEEALKHPFITQEPVATIAPSSSEDDLSPLTSVGSSFGARSSSEEEGSEGVGEQLSESEFLKWSDTSSEDLSFPEPSSPEEKPLI